MSNSANINTGVNSLSNIKGSAKHIAVRIINAMNEDKDPSMCHTFAALTDGAKAIALQAGHYSNTYVRGNANCMDVTAAAQELEAKAAANVSRKLRKIDHAAAVAFLAEYIRRWRNEVAKEPTPAAPETETTTNTATAMTTTDTANNVATAYEETHTARCLDIYLKNTADIYERYTLPLIEAAKNYVDLNDKASLMELFTNVPNVTRALQAAARLVQKYDHMTPTAADVEFVKANYAAYIIECAQYEVTNA